MNGTATAADLITVSLPAATMRVVPFWAVQTDDNWVGSIVAANNFGPQPASLANRLLLHDSAGRTFKNLGPSDFPEYDSLLNTEQSDHAGLFGDHPLVAYTLPIPPGQDAFVLLVFRIASDSDDLTMVAAS